MAPASGRSTGVPLCAILPGLSWAAVLACTGNVSAVWHSLRLPELRMTQGLTQLDWTNDIVVPTTYFVAGSYK